MTFTLVRVYVKVPSIVLNYAFLSLSHAAILYTPCNHSSPTTNTARKLRTAMAFEDLYRLLDIRDAPHAKLDYIYVNIQLGVLKVILG